jgi:hypothetical protein
MDLKAFLVPYEYVLADVLVRCDDEATRKGITRGYYVSQINQALEKLSINTYFDEQEPIDAPMPKNLRWHLPDNFFNIMQLYAWNGDCCSPTTSANIYYKRTFNNGPTGQGYTALNKGSQQSSPDPYYWYWDYNTEGGENNMLFANVSNGVLQFSSACSGYQNFRIIYSGLGGIIGQNPLVPRPLRAVVTDLVVLAAAEILAVKFPKSQYGALYDRINAKLYNKMTGTFWEAEMLDKQSDRWIQECRNAYVGNYAGY